MVTDRYARSVSPWRFTSVQTGGRFCFVSGMLQDEGCMSRESKQTRRALIAAVPSLHGQAIESRGTGPGIPDIWFTTCAVECKCLKRWPVKPETEVKLEHPLTLEQYRWLTRRYRSGYPTYVALQANRKEWFVFASVDAHVLMHRFALPRVQLGFRALRHWSNGLDVRELETLLDSSWTRIEDHRYANQLHQHEVIL